MIFRRYTTLLFLLVVLGLSWMLWHAGPYLGNSPVWQGSSQDSRSNYPLPSGDRVLIKLDGLWQNYDSLQAASASPSVGTTVYNNVPGAMYNQQETKGGLPVPGSWQANVVVKQFFLSNDLAGRRFNLQFLGLGSDAKVFLNGFTATSSVGQLPASNVPITVDVPTPRLKFGQVNTVAIELQKAPSNGPWLEFPGITGDVYLQALGSITIASPQIATTIDAGGPQLSYKIPYQSSLPAVPLTSEVSLFDASGNKVVSATQTFPGANSGDTSGKLRVPQAHLWKPADPYLYRLTVTLTSAGGERDSYSLPIGLRQISFQGKLMLNGTELIPKVLQRVNDAPFNGGAANPAAVDRDLAWAKAQGYNIVVIPDHTPEPYLWDAADRQGILLLSDTGPATYPSKDLLSQRMAQQKTVQELFGYHASFLAQGIGAGLDLQDPKIQAYLQQAKSIGPTFYTKLGKPSNLIFSSGWGINGAGPYLADFLAAKPSFQGPDFISSHINPVGILDRQRKPKESSNSGPRRLVLSNWVFWLLAFALAVLLLQSWSLGNLRYSDLLEVKHKRKLRRIIKQQLYWLILRWAFLALIAGDLATHFAVLPAVDYLIERIPLPHLQVLVWYLLANPLELAITVFATGLVMAWLLAWPRARALPNRPGCMAVLLWLEKRKRWLVPALGLWLWAVNGGLYWPFWLLLASGLLLSAWLVSKDLRVSGGKAYSLFYVFGVAVLVVLVIVCNWETAKYLYHWSRV